MIATRRPNAHGNSPAIARLLRLEAALQRSATKGAFEIRSDRVIESRRVSLLVECKKLKPESIDSLSFRSPRPRSTRCCAGRSSDGGINQTTWEVVVRHRFGADRSWPCQYVGTTMRLLRADCDLQ